MRMLGKDGMERVSDFAVLNANYLMRRLATPALNLPFPERRASHEFIISLKKEARETGVTAMDFAKALLDHGFTRPRRTFRCWCRSAC